MRCPCHTRTVVRVVRKLNECAELELLMPLLSQLDSPIGEAREEVLQKYFLSYIYIRVFLYYPVVLLVNMVLFNHIFSIQSKIVVVKLVDEFEVLNSKQKPKRIILIGSDGREYFWLVKQEASGDLRKDTRLLEVAGYLNSWLAAGNCKRGRCLEVMLNNTRKITMCIYNQYCT